MPSRADSAYRLVGYLEYAMALDHFDRLADASTAAELKVVDEILAPRDEFAVYTNLSRRLEPAGSTLSELPSRPGDNFQRRGLAWVMALARVELGAIAAGFSNDERPFDMARPSNFEAEAYFEILADSMRSHYWALHADPVAQNPRKAGLTDEQAIAYTRRVHLAGSLLYAVRDRARGALSPEQLGELKRWEKDIARLQQTLLFDVLKLGVSLTAETNDTRTDDQRKLGGITASDAELARLPACVKNAAESPLTSARD